MKLNKHGRVQAAISRLQGQNRHEEANELIAVEAARQVARNKAREERRATLQQVTTVGAPESNLSGNKDVDMEGTQPALGEADNAVSVPCPVPHYCIVILFFSS